MARAESFLSTINRLFTIDLQQRQVNTLAMITFWSQFSVYTLNTVMILYLTRPLWKNGLGLNEASAYAFLGVTQAMNYIMPMLGGYMADAILGIRRSILIGSILLAIAYLLVMLSGVDVANTGKSLFLAAYALIPVTNSLLMGTASSMVANIYEADEARAKSGMTIYYTAINVGALLATLIAPQLFDSRFGPLSIFALVFVGKSLAALNFAYRYKLYDNVVKFTDTLPLNQSKWAKLVFYIAGFYMVALFAYHHPDVSSYLIAIGCSLGILWFLIRSLSLQGNARIKQCIAIFLIVEAIVFFVLYNQMNSTLILFAQKNSNLSLLGFTVSPAHYQMINPLSIILLGLILPKFYQRFQNFHIPLQFAWGTMLSGIALLLMWFACINAHDGYVSGNTIALTYFIITVAELFVSAIGLSMIGLYCDKKMVAFAMGTWYLSNSLAYVLSGQIAKQVALPQGQTQALTSLKVFQDYYFDLGFTALLVGILMLLLALYLSHAMKKRGLRLA